MAASKPPSITRGPYPAPPTTAILPYGENMEYKPGTKVWLRATVGEPIEHVGWGKHMVVLHVPSSPRAIIHVDKSDVAPYGQARNKELESRLSALEQETEAQWHILQMHEYGLPGNYHYAEPEEDLYKGTHTGDEVINRMEAHSVGVRLPARNQKFGDKFWTAEEVEDLCREAFAAHHQVPGNVWDSDSEWFPQEPIKANWRRAIVAVLYNLGLSNTPPHLYEDGQGLK